MHTLTITLTPAQKTALTNAFDTLNTAIDGNQFQRALALLRRVSPAKRDAILAAYPRLNAIIGLGQKLRVE
jgi:hypothetical protein